MVVLATKVYVQGDARERSLDALRSLVENVVGDLDVDYTVGVRRDDFAVVTLDGEDEVVARNLLREEYGEITPDFESVGTKERQNGDDETVESGETYVGTLEAWDEDGFVLDAGEEIRVPASELGLGQGTPIQIVERFGLVQHMPLKFVYAASEGGTHSLADAERDRLYDWTRGSGRVNVNSATRGEVRATVNRAGHARDIVTVERLGLLEQSIVCKDETDPPGLLAAIGDYIPAEIRCVIP